MSRCAKLKRLIDIAIATIALTVLVPVFVLVALFVRLDSPGPLFFRQVRVGRGGREFRIWKFRSMVADAERRGPYQTLRGDPRITRVGAFLRRTSVDELPQLMNVLIGDMSLVGPRPDVPAQRSLYTSAEWEARHRVRPGITGLAQATLRSDATPEERKRLDLQYAGHPTLLVDMRIVGLTIRQVLGRGSF